MVFRGTSKEKQEFIDAMVNGTPAESDAAAWEQVERARLQLEPSDSETQQDGQAPTSYGPESGELSIRFSNFVQHLGAVADRLVSPPPALQ